jgi:hypothetical protein
MFARMRERWGLAIGAWMVAASASADVAYPLPPTLALVAVETVSTTSPDDEAEQARRHVNHALSENSDLSRCLDDVRVVRNAGSISATLTFERSREPRLEVRTAGRIPSAARRCVETSARDVRLWNAPSATIVVRARFRVVSRRGRPSHTGGGRRPWP